MSDNISGIAAVPTDASIFGPLAFADELQSQLDDIIASIENKLDPILRPSDPQATEAKFDPGTPEQLHSTLFQSIDNLNGRAARSLQKLGALRSRIELG